MQNRDLRRQSKSAFGEAAKEGACGIESAAQILGAANAFQRVWASTRNPALLVELKKLNDTLDPFRLAEVIEQKLEQIYRRIARRHSPGPPSFNHQLQGRSDPPGKIKNGPAKGWGKDVRPRRQLGYIPKCLDGNTQGYILSGLTRSLLSF